MRGMELTALQAVGLTAESVVLHHHLERGELRILQRDVGTEQSCVERIV